MLSVRTPTTAHLPDVTVITPTAHALEQTVEDLHRRAAETGVRLETFWPLLDRLRTELEGRLAGDLSQATVGELVRWVSRLVETQERLARTVAQLLGIGHDATALAEYLTQRRLKHRHPEALSMRALVERLAAVQARLVPPAPTGPVPPQAAE